MKKLIAFAGTIFLSALKASPGRRELRLDLLSDSSSHTEQSGFYESHSFTSSFGEPAHDCEKEGGKGTKPSENAGEENLIAFECEENLDTCIVTKTTSYSQVIDGIKRSGQSMVDYSATSGNQERNGLKRKYTALQDDDDLDVVNEPGTVTAKRLPQHQSAHPIEVSSEEDFEEKGQFTQADSNQLGKINYHLSLQKPTMDHFLMILDLFSDETPITLLAKYGITKDNLKDIHMNYRCQLYMLAFKLAATNFPEHLTVADIQSDLSQHHFKRILCHHIGIDYEPWSCQNTSTSSLVDKVIATYEF